MRYLDTSILVSAVSANEAASERVQVWFDRQEAGDAPHLAVAFDNGATLCSLDRRQVEAAGILGVMAELI